MSNFSFLTINDIINSSKKQLFKRPNKHLCKLKTNKFRAQQTKLVVSSLSFWKTISLGVSEEVQYLNVNKYKYIQIKAPSLNHNKETSVILDLNMFNVLDNTCQPWFLILNQTLVMVNSHSKQVHLFNIQNIKRINIIASSNNHVQQMLPRPLYKKVKGNIDFNNYSRVSAPSNQPNFKVAKSLLVKALLKYKFNANATKQTNLFKNHIKKFSKKWYNFEHKKFKRFKSKYDGRDLRQISALTLSKLPVSSFKKWWFIRFGNQFSFAKNLIMDENSRNSRIKALLSTGKAKKQKKTKKNYFKYTKFKRKFVTGKKNNVLKIIHIRDQSTINSSFKEVDQVLFTKSKQVCKHFKKNKINLIRRAYFTNSKIGVRRTSKYDIKSQKIKTALKKINQQINYKLKWFNYYEFKSFRWKFQKKRWYFMMSRWKRLAEFRRIMRNAWRNYRKLQKNFSFIKLLRANFKHILGIKETELLKTWVKIRRGTNLNNTICTVDHLNQALQLKLDGLSLFLGLAPNRLMAQELVRFGGLRINGAVVTNENFSLSQNDMLQIDNKVVQEMQFFYTDAHWNSVRARLKFASFLQVQWSIMLFMLVRWPHSYELLEESILNQRWARFFIRYFPVRISKYKKAKVKWYKY